MRNSVEDPGPVFIVGCGRSGTTLLRGLLQAHPKIAIPLESLFVADYLRAAEWMTLDDLKKLIIHEPELEEWGIEVALDDVRDCATIAELISRLHEIYAIQHRKERWGQKTPRLVRHLDLLRSHFPNACYIHLVRDPRAVVRSLVHSNVHRSTPWHAANRWVNDVSAGMDFESRFPDRMLRIHYEQLAASPEATLSQILGFLKLEMVDQILESGPGAEEYSKFYNRIHSHLEQGVTDEFVDRWKVDLSDSDLALVESVTRPLMERLGYSPVTQGWRHSPARRLEMTARRSIGLARQLWHYLHYRPKYLLHLARRKWRLGLFREFLKGVHS